MKSIDLRQYALHSQKLPKSFLDSTTPQKELGTSKLFLAHMFDLGMCLTSFSLMVAFYNVTVRSLLLTHKLQLAFSEEFVGELSLFFLPLTIFSYFFSSYFLNEGQTWGMNLFKARVKMPSKSFRETALWAIHSTLLCLSGGTLLIASKTKWQAFAHSDYLYQNLLVHKDVSMDLLSRISEEEESYFEVQEAA